MKIGVLGAGQLGLMLGKAGAHLGIEFRFFDPSPEAPAQKLGEFVCASWDDHAALDSFAANLDAVTYEFENVPLSAVRRIEAKTKVIPALMALEVGQDRLFEKDLFTTLNIPCAPYKKIETREDLAMGVAEFGYPSILKTRRLGYDGKGQFAIKSPEDLDAAWKTLSKQDLILEDFVNFDRELSIIVSRDIRGKLRYFPLVENHHKDGILRLSLAPAPRITGYLQKRAQSYAQKILATFNFVGTLTIELFQSGNELIANELAPRVHNSGHWSIEGAETSQFENHMRAVMGKDLGDTSLRGFCAMINLIGFLPDEAQAKALKKVFATFLHVYGKEPKPGRKVGHITVIGDTDAIRTKKLQDINEIFGGTLIPDSFIGTT